jgi:polyhydroxybutyrate depolymerase
MNGGVMRVGGRVPATGLSTHALGPRWLLGCLCLLMCLVVPTVHASGLRLSLGGVERRALVVNAPPPGTLRPAVLVLHGGRGSAQEQRDRTGFDEIAQREGFMVVYPEGTPWGRGFHAWNTGYMQRRQVGEADDIAYLDALIDLLVARHGADPRGIFMTGGSNGAMMTLVYATRRAERLAAIAPVVGAMFSFEDTPARPLPTLLINGAADAEVPLEGGMSRNPLVRSAQAAPFKPLEETVAFWRRVNRSEPSAQMQTQGTVTTRTWAATPGGAVTSVVVDAAGGHGWPGTPALRAGNVPIQAFKGAERVWEFFKQHLP